MTLARIANRNVVVLATTVFVNLVFYFMWAPLLPLYLRHLGASDLEIGVAYSALTIGHSLFSVLGGMLADRVGRKPVTVLPTLLEAPFMIAAGLTSNWLLVVVFLFIVNALGAVQYPAFMAGLAESVDEKYVGRAYSLVEIGVVSGLTVGPLIGAGLIACLNVGQMLILTGVAYMGTTLARQIVMTETKHQSAPLPWAKLPAAFNPNVLWFIGASSLIWIAFQMSVFGPYVTILANDVWKNTEGEINLIFAVGNFSALGGIVFGRLADKHGGKKLLLGGMLVYAVLAGGWGAATNVWIGLPFVIGAFALSEGLYIAHETLLATLTTKETRASVMGVFSTITGVISGLGPTLGAWLITLNGRTAMPFWGALVASALSALVLTRVGGRQVDKETGRQGDKETRRQGNK